MSNDALSADRRAYELLDFIGVTQEPLYTMCFEAARRSFKEHARDQRHLCAESVLDIEWEWVDTTRQDAHAAVMNAPEPGMHK